MANNGRLQPGMLLSRSPRRGGKTARTRRGAMLIFLAVLMTAFLVAVALSVDIAYMQLARVELRTATDAAARAAMESLSRTQNEATARQAAHDVVERNRVAGQAFALDDADITFGESRQDASGNFHFTPGGTWINACRVNGRKTADAPAGPVSLFFGNSFGTPFFSPEETAVASQLDRDICLVLDRSGSMAWRLNNDRYPPGRNECTLADPTRSRWGQLVMAVEVFLSEINATAQEEKLALVTFSTRYSRCGITVPRSEIDCPLTVDYARIQNAIERRTTTMPIIGGTAISGGLDDGVRALTDTSVTRRFALKTVILLTDGVHNDGRSPIEAARDAAAQDIVVHTITYSSNANQADMIRVAEITGGKHFHAPTAASLRDVFREIAWTVPVLLTE